MRGVILPRRVLLFLVVSGFCASAMSSDAVITFEKTYGGPYDDLARCVQKTCDNGYILAGDTDPSGAGYQDWYLMKTDSVGGISWSIAYGLDGHDHCYSVLETAGGDLVASGTMCPFAGYPGFMLFGMDSSGDTVWARNHGDICKDCRVRQTSEGGYITVGARHSTGSAMDLVLVKTDSVGELMWVESYGGHSSDFGYDVIQTSDGGYLGVGETWSFGEGLYDVYLVKTNASGDLNWSKTYGGPEGDMAYSVAPAPDEGYLVAGYTASLGAGGRDLWLLRLDSAGDSLWTRPIGGALSDGGIALEQTSDGGYIVSGWTQSFGAGSSDVYIVKLDSSGNSIWARTYGGPGNEYGYSIRQTSDGGYIIAGSTTSFGAGGSDVYLIKTDTLGLVSSCNPVEPWVPRTQGCWRRQCKHNPHEDICAYVDSVHILANLFDAFDCDSICDLMNVNPPENDMCRKARRQFMALLLNVASGKLAVCNCLADGREVGDVIVEIDSLLSADTDFHTCENAKTLADDINNGIGIVPCDTTWTQAPPEAVEPPSVSVTPNPFSKSTVVEYELKVPGHVRLDIYDKTGRLVRTLVDSEQGRGRHQIEWDGLNESGIQVPQGIYFSRLQIRTSVTSNKLLLLR